MRNLKNNNILNNDDMITNGLAYLNTKIRKNNYHNRENRGIIFYVPENVALEDGFTFSHVFGIFSAELEGMENLASFLYKHDMEKFGNELTPEFIYERYFNDSRSVPVHWFSGDLIEKLIINKFDDGVKESPRDIIKNYIKNYK